MIDAITELVKMSLPVIERVAVQTVLVPINPPHRTASGLVEKSPLVLIDLHCSGGLVGHAIVFTYTRAALKATAELFLGLGPLIVGQPLALRQLMDLLFSKTRLIGDQGLIGTVLADMQLALSAQLLAVGSTSHQLEYVDWWAEILAEPQTIEDGLTVLPDDLIGTGVSWNHQNLDTYRV